MRNLWFSSSLRTSRCRGGGWFHGFTDAHCAITLHECFVGHPADVRLAYLVDALDIAEQLAPVTKARLKDRKLLRKACIIGESTDQVRLGARLNHPQFVVADVFFLHTVDLSVNGIA